MRLKKEKWYWIEYTDDNPEYSFYGPAKLVNKNINRDGINYHTFDSPIGGCNMVFIDEDIKNECKKIPTYNELLKICKLKIEDFRYAD